MLLDLAIRQCSLPPSNYVPKEGDRTLMGQQQLLLGPRHFAPLANASALHVCALSSFISAPIHSQLAATFSVGDPDFLSCLKQAVASILNGLRPSNPTIRISAQPTVLLYTATSSTFQPPLRQGLTLPQTLFLPATLVALVPSSLFLATSLGPAFVVCLRLRYRLRPLRLHQGQTTLPLRPSSASRGSLPPLKSISMDFIVKLPTSHGCNTIWVVVDCFSKMAHFIPLSRLSRPRLGLTFLQHIFQAHGLPDTIISDRGSIFVSQFWTRLHKLIGVRLKHLTAYHPRTNGQTKRINQILEAYLRCYTSYQQDDWVDYLPLAEFAYNNPLYQLQYDRSAAEDLSAQLSLIHDKLQAKLTHSQANAASNSTNPTLPLPFDIPGRVEPAPPPVFLNGNSTPWRKVDKILDCRKSAVATTTLCLGKGLPPTRTLGSRSRTCLLDLTNSLNDFIAPRGPPSNNSPLNPSTPDNNAAAPFEPVRLPTPPPERHVGYTPATQTTLRSGRVSHPCP
ncbi:Reverse transcriptase (RNA-dependent DNA polymerase) [Rhizoctonia solani]|uniref:Reverse transcriptase (RNA-dependent DNA polymerase) n=1 Tax=Rhizoctonia solani TaxID=456999 RepID=A0A8H7I3M4_9AGAM|nr:Reverse transcriptase (RNA-dependent DNA polymerase) [Rhizoctonia solani]